MLSRLGQFLRALPPGPTIGVEFRDAGWLNETYLRLLKTHSVRHCISVHPRMPRPRAQWRFAAAKLGPTLVRWNLGHNLGYNEAKSAYTPFNRLVAPDESMRREIAQICVRSVAFAQPTFVTINNKAEGCAPLSVAALRETVDTLRAS